MLFTTPKHTLYPSLELVNLCCSANLSLSIWCMSGCRYAAPLYIDIEQTVRVKDGEGEVLEENVEKYDKIFMGEVPIMLRSSYCSLHERSNRELTTLGECPYDQASTLVSPAHNAALPRTASV